MAIKMKTVIKMNMHAECVSHARTDVAIRDLTVVVDEPLERGGTNLGAAPTEMLIAALAACTNVIGQKCAGKNGVEVTSLDINVETEFDRRGVTLAEEVEVPFPKITLNIDLVTPSSNEAVEGMKSDLRKFCPLAKVIRHSGTQLDEVWTVSQP
ncbi:MAG: OsmC family protein [Rhodospirillaceae bacterium]|nr:OsmC family protein [Rhodospirillaceae bacterium]